MIRRIIASLCVLVALLQATVGSPRADEDAEMRVFGKNAASAGALLGPSPDPSQRIQERWQFATRGYISTSPVAVDGVVYVGSDNNVYALDATVGTKLWEFTAGSTITASPAEGDGMVFVASADCNVYALGPV